MMRFGVTLERGNAVKVTVTRLLYRLYSPPVKRSSSTGHTRSSCWVAHNPNGQSRPCAFVPQSNALHLCLSP